MTVFDPDKITFFAKTDARGREVAFGIKAKDRQRHMYVVGKTGMGKSTLLENMAAQDIMNGEGMAFIDPHGSAAETLLNYVPEHRVKDVVYFAPFDLDHPISFNVMEDVGPDKRHLVVSGLMSTFKKIWVDAWSARMEYILTNALLALIEYPDTTLLSVNRMFADKAYREKVVDYIKDPAVKSFWVDEFASYTDRYIAESVPSIQNKIGQFTGNPLIRNIIGQPHSSFDIRELMDNQKILIMNLSKGLIGETNANLLGSMLTTRIYLAAMSRADLSVDDMRRMPNFYFYVDEFQSFANATFANILSEARKYHLNLIIAHQYIEQMEEDVRNAVFGNVGTTIAFRVGPFDAETLETVFSPRFLAADLVNLGFAQVYLTLMIDGIGSHPFSAKTLPRVEQPAISCREMVIESSRQFYGHNREEVEKVVTLLHAHEKTEAPKKGYEKRNDAGGRAPEKGRPAQGDQRRTPPVSASVIPQLAPVQRPREIPLQDQPRKKLPEKTPDDLRQILSNLSQQKSEKKVTDGEPQSNSVEKKVMEEERPLRPAEKKVTEPMVKDGRPTMPVERLVVAAKPIAPTRPMVNKGEEKPSELKRALADALQKAAAVAPAPLPSVRTEVPKEPLSPAPVVGQSVPVPQPSRATVAPRPTPPSFRVATQPPAYRSQIRNVVVEQRRRQQPEPAKPLTPPIQKPNASDTASLATLDTAVIKRLLGQSDQERSPFK